MPAYCFVNLHIHDPEGYAEYRKRTLATIEAFGGRFLVRGGEVEVKEGDWRPGRVILLEFPSMEVARRWYDSPQYQAIIGYRTSTATTDLVFLEGLPS